MSESKYTILVSSCDAYEDLWQPFFYLLNKNWPTLCQKNIMLNTESKSFSYPGLNIQTLKNNKNINCTWSERLKNHLIAIDNDYILVLLDDFFIESFVDEGKIDFCVNEMKNDKTITHFGFVPTLWENAANNRYEDFELRKKNTPFRVNTQAGLWRKSELIKLIREHESPWDFEVFASIRSRRTNGKYYVAKQGKPQAFNYDWFNGGAVHRGKWTKRAVEILNENSYDINFEKRGYDTDTVFHPDEIPLDPLEKNIIGRTLIRISVLFKNWRSIL